MSNPLSILLFAHGHAGVATLRGLHSAGHRITGVVTIGKPRGRVTRFEPLHDSSNRHHELAHDGALIVIARTRNDHPARDCPQYDLRFILWQAANLNLFKE